MEKASQFYFRYGIKATTLDEISRELGISKKTIYRHFKDKEELVEKALRYHIERFEIDLNIYMDGETNAIDKVLAIKEMITSTTRVYNNPVYFELKRTYPQLYEQLNNSKREYIYQAVKENILEGQQQGLYRADFNIDYIARMYIGRTLLTINPEFEIFSEEEALSNELTEELLAYHMHAICTPPGITYYKKKTNTNQ